jgi:prepilin-type N-terminal cleavage/methylation domain-containing protein
VRRGVTLPEIATVLAIIGVVATVAAPHVGRWRDRTAVRRAATEMAAFYELARLEAIYRAARVRLEFGTDSLRAVLEDGSDSVVLARAGPSRHGVSFTASRSVIRIHPNGLGFGGANTTLVLRRGSVRESLTTSRLGRLRWQ